MRGRVLLLVAASVVLVLGMATGASGQQAELEFVAPDTVTTSVSDAESEEVSVWLKNTSDREVTPEFKALLENDDGEGVTSAVRVRGIGRKPTPPIPAQGVNRYRLSLSGASESSGQLVAMATGLAPATVSIAVASESDISRGVDGALLIPFGIAVLVICAAWFYGHKDVGLKDSLGTLELDFTKSFASTLTAVGVLLGTIISAGVLPEETVNFSKAGFTGLNLIFGIAVAVAGIVYAGVQKPVLEKSPDGKTKEWMLQGRVWAFLVATLITVWAVLGEIWTMWFLVDELGHDNGFTDFAVTAVRILLILAAVALIPYTLRKVEVTISKKPTAAAAAASAFPTATREQLRPVSLL